MKQKRVQFKIDPKGNWEMTTKEGFSGTSCTEQTKSLELAIGGAMAAEGKTDDYYRPDDETPVSIKM